MFLGINDSTMHFEFLVEELSAEMALHNLLPKLLVGEHTYRIISFQGKKDLLDKLPKELRGYQRWIDPDFKIIVLIDRDGQDCHVLKNHLEELSANAHLITKSKANKNLIFNVLNRIAIEELEAWFFGDHEAVKIAYPRVSNTFQNKAQYRNPDQISGGTWEALERVLKAAGYFKYGYRKTEAAANISKHMEPLRNRSKSFQIFWSGIADIIDAL
jgi:hypothetical protein